MNNGILLIVLLALVALVLLAVVAMARRNSGSKIRVTPLPAAFVAPYESRLPELEKMFVHQPREAVAAAKLLVDDMLHRMGFPVRMSAGERVKDLVSLDRGISRRYGTAAGIRDDASTEQLRQSLTVYLQLSRELLSRAERSTEVRDTGRTEIA